MAYVASGPDLSSIAFRGHDDLFLTCYNPITGMDASEGDSSGSPTNYQHFGIITYPNGHSVIKSHAHQTYVSITSKGSLSVEQKDPNHFECSFTLMNNPNGTLTFFSNTYRSYILAREDTGSMVTAGPLPPNARAQFTPVPCPHLKDRVMSHATISSIAAQPSTPTDWINGSVNGAITIQIQETKTMRYISAQNGTSPMIMYRGVPRPSEQFMVHSLGSNRIALQSASNGKFVSVPGTRSTILMIKCSPNADSITDTEVFEIQRLTRTGAGPNEFSLRTTVAGKYIEVQNDDEVVAWSTEIHSVEGLTVTVIGGTIAPPSSAPPATIQTSAVGGPISSSYGAPVSASSSASSMSYGHSASAPATAPLVGYGSAPAAPPSDPRLSGWYLSTPLDEAPGSHVSMLTKPTQVSPARGPLELAEVLRMYDAGEVSKRSVVWHAEVVSSWEMIHNRVTIMRGLYTSITAAPRY